MPRVLVTDDIDAEGVAILTAEPSLQVDEVPTLPVAELHARIGDYDAIVGRSATRITRELLEKGTNLRVVGRAGVGVDNIAVDVATALGIAVINAPAGNTVAVAELVFGALIGLLRQIPRAATGMHAGKWERGDLLGRELKGKVLGIVGLGRIGSEVAQRAHAFGMPVVAFDPYVGDERFATLRVQRMPTLEALIAEANIVTVHTPLTSETRGMIGKREIDHMLPRSVLVNMARGGIIDEDALVAALQANQLRGAIVDVFTAEPLAADHPLRTLPNTLLTPHLGANSIEAQRNVAKDVCVGVRDALLRKDLSRSINVAAAAGDWVELQPAMLLARGCAAVARALLADQGTRAITQLTVRCGPSLAGGSSALLSSAAVGVLEGVLETDRLNLINARTSPTRAASRSPWASPANSGTTAPWRSRSAAACSSSPCAGVSSAEGIRLTRIGAFHVDVNPRQTLIVLTNHDVPGVIGHVGTVLGEAKVNIAEYHQARLAQGGDALAAITVDGNVDESTRERLLALPQVRSASIVQLGEK